MAILAPFPVIPTPGVSDLVDSRWLAFESLDGGTVFQATGHEFFIQEGIDGLGIPPREIVTKKYPGMAGAQLKEIRTLEREIFLPLFIENSSAHAEYLNDLDALAALFDYRTVDYAANDGTLNLVATSAKGTRRLRCTYTQGMDTGYGTSSEGATWASIGLKFLCVQPYWYGDTWTTPIIQQIPITTGTFPAFPIELSSNVILGNNISVTVPGDVESYVTIDLVGPTSSVEVSSDGLLFSIPAGLADGEPAKIVTDPRSRTATFSGIEDWSRVGPATLWRPLAPGDHELDITLADGGTNTRAQVSGRSFWERPW
jgi:hypothetical protein